LYGTRNLAAAFDFLRPGVIVFDSLGDISLSFRIEFGHVIDF
jgi:hypothetical protein